ncbi:MAG TPA: PilT/PilU family type 4a pilus ATPase [Candidatus Pacearchaeota archaeon]|nr:PilT/PilU family type 4a pilus ATPase [Candidatus Parcubacteria bacterium]HOU45790.1 PilT/PilU family type 4a pilus ATPase [Candidatus Pacearchaeota archaeon]HQI74519.1 PilT/PilU family type 4a pilus ATPase [Candidatus Pacearchaeota archaeon]
MEDKLKKILTLTIQKQASDLHLCVGHTPVLRIKGKLYHVKEWEVLTDNDLLGFCKMLLNKELFDKLSRDKDVDFSYSFENQYRFRGNIYFQMGRLSCSLRLIPNRIKNLEELSLPEIFHKFTEPKQGFVLVTGPSNQGKSTTLAAMIDEISRNRSEHIITIEDPIEYIFADNKCIIDQREVGRDAQSFARALRASLRQDPNVLMVGEMRDLETISIALTASETGHLVFATLHTNSAAETIHRVVDTFPAEQQGQIKLQLSSCLYGIISQRLVPAINGDLVPAYEILFNNSAVANLIRENKVHEIPSVIETSSKDGMISLNKCLAGLVNKNIISMETAISHSNNPTELKTYLNKTYEI